MKFLIGRSKIIFAGESFVSLLWVHLVSERYSIELIDIDFLICSCVARNYIRMFLLLPRHDSLNYVWPNDKWNGMDAVLEDDDLPRFYSLYCLEDTIGFLIFGCIIRLLGLVGRVFPNGPADLGSIPGRVIPKTLKMFLGAGVLNTQQYKVRIKGTIYPTPPLGQDMTQGQFLSGV